MAIELKKYIRFHKDKFDKRGGRKLKIEWDHALGYATLMAHFRSGPKELSVGLLQAIVLLLFNDADEVSFQDIASRTKIGASTLSHNLQVSDLNVFQSKSSSAGPYKALRARRSASSRSIPRGAKSTTTTFSHSTPASRTPSPASISIPSRSQRR